MSKQNQLPWHIEVSRFSVSSVFERIDQLLRDFFEQNEAEESGSLWEKEGEAVQIPCKHLQWICELFKRLNSLKNLVCTGAVCHRRHPPFATPTSLYIERNGGSSLPQTTRRASPPLSLTLSFFSVHPRPSISPLFLPPVSYPLYF